MTSIIKGIIWMAGFMVVPVGIVAIGKRFEEASFEGMVVMYMVGFLIGTIISQYCKEK